jgi:hypothetical protein
MINHKQADMELSLLFKETYHICCELYDLTLHKLSTLNSDSDEDIIDFINNRETFINKLVVLENSVYQIFDNHEEYENGRLLPHDIETERQKTRLLLNAVTELDLKAIKLLNDKVQVYKDKTLQVRNKKNISAYLKSSMPLSSAGNYDILN